MTAQVEAVDEHAMEGIGSWWGGESVTECRAKMGRFQVQTSGLNKGTKDNTRIPEWVSLRAKM